MLQEHKICKSFISAVNLQGIICEISVFVAIGSSNKHLGFKKIRGGVSWFVVTVGATYPSSGWKSLYLIDLRLSSRVWFEWSTNWKKKKAALELALEKLLWINLDFVHDLCPSLFSYCLYWWFLLVLKHN